MKTRLRMKCRNCGHWNRFEMEKVFLNPVSPEPQYPKESQKLLGCNLWHDPESNQPKPRSNQQIFRQEFQGHAE
jgi:hypothetical protein